MVKKAYICGICSPHYRDDATAKRCRGWCAAHKDCSMEITKQSIELSGE